MSHQPSLWVLAGPLFFASWWPVAVKVMFGLGNRTRNWMFLASAIIFAITVLDLFGHLDRLNSG
jgi:hypothetical protein